MPQTNEYEPSAMSFRVHSITFAAGLNSDGSLIDPRNTWDHFHIVSSERPTVAPPEPKTNYVEIPGGNGSLDLSEALTGYPTYENREGEFEFAVLNDYETNDGEQRQKVWHRLFNEIAVYLHGRKMIFVLSDDPEYYYEGRLTLSEFQSTIPWSTIRIGYNVKPFKRSRAYMAENNLWMWDTFNFETDYIGSSLFTFSFDEYVKEIELSSEYDFFGLTPVSPVIYVSEASTERFHALTIDIYKNGSETAFYSADLNAGENVLTGVTFDPSNSYKIEFMKNYNNPKPTVSIRFRKETF